MFEYFSSFGLYTPSASLHDWVIFPPLQVTFGALQSWCNGFGRFYTPCKASCLGLVLRVILFSRPFPPLELGRAPSGLSLMQAMEVLSVHCMDPADVLCSRHRTYSTYSISCILDDAWLFFLMGETVVNLSNKPQSSHMDLSLGTEWANLCEQSWLQAKRFHLKLSGDWKSKNGTAEGICALLSVWTTEHLPGLQEQSGHVRVCVCVNVNKSSPRKTNLLKTC